MKNWIETVEPLVYVSRIKVPYTWSVGEVGSRFLTELRDYKKIFGTRCGKCNTVYVPPKKTCGQCFLNLQEWMEVGPQGTLITHTVVHYQSPVMLMKPPFAYGIILLDKANTGLVHLLDEVKFEEIKTNMRVEPVFKDERTGDILDIKYFRPVR
jgi:uncharacterized OB-fold protein